MNRLKKNQRVKISYRSIVTTSNRWVDQMDHLRQPTIVGEEKISYRRRGRQGGGWRRSKIPFKRLGYGWEHSTPLRKQQGPMMRRLACFVDPTQSQEDKQFDNFFNNMPNIRTTTTTITTTNSINEENGINNSSINTTTTCTSDSCLINASIESNKFKVLGDNKCTGIDHHQQASVDKCEMGGEDIDVGIVDFHFVDDIRSSCCYYLPFEITEEMVEEQESYGGEEKEPSGLTEAMKTMKYERKFSTSPYAFNGISECLKLKLGSENREWSEVKLSNLDMNVVTMI
ncbi:hypothetical protein TEA_010859 [Camellia sinensis var. sinensis]|uniref:Uncharacterized protein n=1 Tax=Camellia sinensis var. sinensis TaxID=542762 RepID=A0A4S4DSY1_CAMSN|nr:hypothetical protein TEA_010859 [Camellia sinensis var. sinensis]